MQDTWLLEVTDLKQYVCCPRLLYYRYCLPDVRPLTYSMEVGIQSHRQEEEKELRRSLQKYQLDQGERLFHLFIASESLGIKGLMDMIIITPNREAIVVDYKHSEQKAGPHFKLQLAAYALLLEEKLQMPVRRGFLYSIPLRKAEEVPITPALRKKVGQVIQKMHHLLGKEAFPCCDTHPTTVGLAGSSSGSFSRLLYPLSRKIRLKQPCRILERIVLSATSSLAATL